MMTKLLLTTALSAAILGGCATGTKPIAPAPLSVTAAFETPVMKSAGDSADDPAIYIGADGKGFIAGTDKQAGLYIYNLDGSQRDFLPLGTLNNVDLREGFQWNGEEFVLLVSSNDELRNITVTLYNPRTDKFITPKGSLLPTGEFEPYGICLGMSVNGTFHAGVTSKAGIYQQYIINAENESLTARKVREFSTGTKTEGCVFDDRTGQLYINEEGGGLYRYPASPSGKDAQIVIAKVGDNGIAADLEGVTVYEDGDDAGYVLISSQGNNSFAAYQLPDHTFAGRFNVDSGAVDGVSTTDGIAATSKASPQFPKGFLVVQDDEDDTSPSQARKKQNFKVIDWRDIEAILK